MSNIPNEQTRWVLAERPVAEPTDATFRKETVPIPHSLADDEVLVRVDITSLEAAMRGWLTDFRSYRAPVQIGEVMRSAGVGEVVKGGKTLKVGDLVSGGFGWQEYAVVKESAVQKVDIPPGGSPIDEFGATGTNGLAAYFGITTVGQLKPGETLVVSGAAGATGSFAAAIGKIKGAGKVVGIAGGPDKVKFLKEEVGVDLAYDYKSADWKEKFIEEVGLVDVFFDNVGGEILDFVLSRIRRFARIVESGAISTYNTSEPYGIKNYPQLTKFSATLQGYIFLDYASEFPAAKKELAQWAAEGKLPRKFHIVDGVDALPKALGDIFSGANTGKTVVRVSKEALRFN
ncbi:alcohol dehydrogenase [Cantharellus anzutake]|uniref:alcohol dehydrogenase n=1 Tax=Cantharellus anzutake TaxID=1750568 RepID=UPI0019050578|nr:alcohol dehydrogenase [Cantharellus anzutake]KAF8339676.1 alcohol dehydrogenase [Cantharellus anzutake]